LHFFNNLSFTEKNNLQDFLLIEVYTDGSCLGNPGAGGWAFLILKDDQLISKSGSAKKFN
jgi:hypothetical protein